MHQDKKKGKKKRKKQRPVAQVITWLVPIWPTTRSPFSLFFRRHNPKYMQHRLTEPLKRHNLTRDNEKPMPCRYMDYRSSCGKYLVEDHPSSLHVTITNPSPERPSSHLFFSPPSFHSHQYRMKSLMMVIAALANKKKRENDIMKISRKCSNNRGRGRCTIPKRETSQK